MKHSIISCHICHKPNLVEDIGRYTVSGFIKGTVLELTVSHCPDNPECVQAAIELAENQMRIITENNI